MEEIGKFSLGIDIGTSFSCIALCDLSQDPPYRMLKLGNLGNDEVVPSVILYGSDGNVVEIGEEALNAFLHLNSENGKALDFTLVREFKAQFSERLSIGKEKYLEYSEAYEAFLTKIINELRQKLDMTEGRVCITHPARKKNEDAIGPRIIAIAGRVLGQSFEIEGLDEASALVQFLDREEGLLSDKPRIILVIDSGGGTTDIALAKASYNIFGSRKPLHIDNTNRADKGGRNIDTCIYLSAQKAAKLSIDDPVQQEKDLAVLRHNKENFDWDELKKSKLVVQVGNKNIVFAQKQVEEMARPEIEYMLAPVASMTLEQVDMVVLAGGNSLFPPFRKQVRKLFKEHIKIISVNNDDIKTAVAKGASLYVTRTNKQLKFRLGYSISIFNDIKNTERELWKQGTIFPPDRFPLESRRYVDYMITDLASCRIKIQRDSESPIFYDLQFSFDYPLDYKTYVRARFEIDENGYFRYYGEPFGKNVRSEQEIIRHFLFDTMEDSNS